MNFTTRRKELTARKSAPNLRPTSPNPPSLRAKSPVPPLPDQRHGRFVERDAFFGSDGQGLGIGTGGGAGNVGGGNVGGGGGGLSKLLSFPWHRGDKGTKATPPSPSPMRSPPSPSPTSSTFCSATFFTPLPSPSASSIRNGFPRPPPGSALPSPDLPPPPVPARQHPSSAVIPPHLPRVVPNSASSSSSFASTALFSDDWESSSSEATSALTSSPECSSSDAQPRRMWKVNSKAAVGLLLPTGEEDEEAECPTRRHRNSTPTPSKSAKYLLGSDPSTPPRAAHHPHRLSAPFDLGATGRAPQSPEESGDADDEVSPPRVRKRDTRRDSAGVDSLLHSELAYASVPSELTTSSLRTRIPSILFEGISMDAMFAEVEKKVGDEMAERDRKAKRRTRVFSMYRPFEAGAGMSDASFISASSSSSSNTSSLSATDSLASYATISSSGSAEEVAAERDLERSQSTTPTPRIFDAPRPRPLLPRRGSSRPAPLNVAAANAFPVWTDLSTPRTIAVQAYSPPLPSPRSPLLCQSPTALSPSGLGDAFVPYPSPALSSTSTFRVPSSPVPSVMIRPPTPPREYDPDVEPTFPPTPTAEEFATHGGTKVVVVQEKKKVKVSSRASSGPKRRGTSTWGAPTYTTSPTFASSPTFGSSPTFSASPTFGSSPTFSTPPISPVLPAFSTPPLSPPTTAPLNGTFASLSPRRESKRGSFGLSGEEDASDVEEALNSMLLRLAQPHTPPSSPLAVAPPHSAPLTSEALSLHTSRLSSSSPAISGRAAPVHTLPATPEPYDGDSSPPPRRTRTRRTSTPGALSYDYSPSSSSAGNSSRLSLSAFPSNLPWTTTKPSAPASPARSGGGGSESDDSATRFGDAPPVSLPRAVERISVGLAYTLSEEEEEDAEGAGVAIADIRIIPATPSHSAQSSISSNFLAGRERERKRAAEERRVLEMRMEALRMESVESSEGEAEGEGGSATEESSEEDGYESYPEMGVVMMGERISCGYQIGVAV